MRKWELRVINSSTFVRVAAPPDTVRTIKNKASMGGVLLIRWLSAYIALDRARSFSKHSYTCRRASFLFNVQRRGSSLFSSKSSAAQDEHDLKLEEGSENGLYVIQRHILQAPFDWSDIDCIDPVQDVQRLRLETTNITLPVALLLLPKASGTTSTPTYQSLSQARKACRKGYVLIERANSKEKIKGRVGHRVYPGDTVAHQIRLPDDPTSYTRNIPYPKPPFDLPVIYQDDTMAVVHKPAGVVTYRQGSAAVGLQSVRAALPFALTPPSPHQANRQHVMRRPAAVHRLDKATSGLLVVAKTKPALVWLSSQFHDRQVQKTYHAVVLGIPEENWDRCLTSAEVKEQYGVDLEEECAGDEKRSNARWQVIDHPLDEKNAVTIWRALRYVPSLGASENLKDGTSSYLTLVEMHPRTGRYHQLRRHMAWVCGTPIVGDTLYDGGTVVARKFRNNGLFLCSTQVALYLPPTSNHPSTAVECEDKAVRGHHESYDIRCCPLTNLLKLVVTIPLPNKFSTLLEREASRYEKLKCVDPEDDKSNYKTEEGDSL